MGMMGHPLGRPKKKENRKSERHIFHHSCGLLVSRSWHGVFSRSLIYWISVLWGEKKKLLRGDKKVDLRCLPARERCSKGEGSRRDLFSRQINQKLRKVWGGKRRDILPRYVFVVAAGPTTTTTNDLKNGDEKLASSDP